MVDGSSFEPTVVWAVRWAVEWTGIQAVECTGGLTSDRQTCGRDVRLAGEGLVGLAGVHSGGLLGTEVS